MLESGNKPQENNNVIEKKIFPVPFSVGEITENIIINTNSLAKLSKEQIINQALKFHSQGNIQEAAKYYEYLIKQGFKNHRIFSNYGIILKDLGDLKKAELFTRKAIELKPTSAFAHSNLGNICRGLGNLKEAELFTRKAIELKPNFAEAHANLGSILNDLGKLDKAFLSYEVAIKFDKNLDHALEGIGRLLLKKGNHLDGILKIREATGSIGFNPKKSSITIS